MNLSQLYNNTQLSVYNTAKKTDVKQQHKNSSVVMCSV